MPIALEKYLLLIKERPDLFTLPEQPPFRIETDQKIIQAWQSEQPVVTDTIGVIFEDEYFLFLRDLICRPNGSKFAHVRCLEQGWLHDRPGVVMLPVAQNKIMLFSHYRYPILSWSLEIPRGGGEKDISIIENIFKELAEEAAIQSIEEIVDLGEMYASNGFIAGAVRIYLVRVHLEEAHANEDLMKNLRWVDFPTFENLINEDQITDGFTLAAYAKAKAKGLLNY